MEYKNTLIHIIIVSDKMKNESGFFMIFYLDLSASD